MGLGSAFDTAITGLRANSDGLDTVGNNLANVNTTAFKVSRNEFATNFFNTVTIGLPAGTPPPGTNPKQFGQGVNIRSIGVDFRPGAPNITGINSDLFIEGAGFFVVDAGNAAGAVNPQFTRDGSFRLDSDSELVTGNGFKVLGFGLGPTPENFIVDNISRNIEDLVNLPIKLGQLTLADQTENVFIEGILNSDGEIATQTTIQESTLALYDSTTDLAFLANVDTTAGLTTITSTVLGTNFFQTGEVKFLANVDTTAGLTTITSTVLGTNFFQTGGVNALAVGQQVTVGGVTFGVTSVPTEDSFTVNIAPTVTAAGVLGTRSSVANALAVGQQVTVGGVTFGVTSVPTEDSFTVNIAPTVTAAGVLGTSSVATVVTRTGTVDVASGSNVVTGFGTLFTTELDVGSVVTILGETFTVATIVNDTSLTLTANHAAGAPPLTPYTTRLNATFATTLQDVVRADPTLTSILTDQAGANSLALLDANGSFDLVFAPRKGDPRSLPEARLTVRGNAAGANATTLQDFANFVVGSLGINTGDSKIVARDGFVSTPGASVVTPTGFTVLDFLDIEGNLGTESDFRLDPSDFRIEATPANINENNTFVPVGGFSGFQFSLDFNRTRDADGIEIKANGESAFIQWTVFDSLGDPVLMQGVAYLQGRGAQSGLFPNNPGNNRTRWNFLFESPDQTAIGGNVPPTGTIGYDHNIAVVDPDGTTTTLTSFDRDIPGVGFVGQTPNPGDGPTLTLTFDENGKRLDNLTTGLPITVVREVNNASNQPLQFSLNFDSLSSLAAGFSRLAVFDQDGAPVGTLVDFGVSDDGVIHGAFDNGEVRPLGQIALARFTNVNGFFQDSNNIYLDGVNSGEIFIHTPGEAPVGTVKAGALELSNVDLAVQFVDLLNLSNAFNANSRTIATTQELFSTLLQLPRT